MKPQRMASFLAGLSAAGLAIGVGWIYPPAGLVVASLEGLAAAYVIAYLGKGDR